jgi:hypothetical protein
MKAFRIMIAIAAAAALYTLSPVTARGENWTEKATLTFNQPVEIPNLVLPAGTYVFKHLTVAPSLVQISNADETHVFATLITVSDTRDEASEDTVVTFAERTSGAPKAIKEWFYPGDPVGYEFLYRDQQQPRSETK